MNVDLDELADTTVAASRSRVPPIERVYSRAKRRRLRRRLIRATALAGLVLLVAAGAWAAFGDDRNGDGIQVVASGEDTVSGPRHEELDPSSSRAPTSEPSAFATGTIVDDGGDERTWEATVGASQACVAIDRGASTCLTDGPGADREAVRLAVGSASGSHAIAGFVPAETTQVQLVIGTSSEPLPVSGPVAGGRAFGWAIDFSDSSPTHALIVAMDADGTVIGSQSARFRTSPPTGSTVGTQAAERVTVRCLPTGVELSHDTVLAQADGVHLMLENDTGRRVVLNWQGLGAGGGAEVAEGSDDVVMSYPPGTYTLSCTSEGAPIGSEGVLSIADLDGFYVPGPMPCREGSLAWLYPRIHIGETAEEAAAKAFADVAQDGLVERVGYRDQILHWIARNPDGLVVAKATVMETATGFESMVNSHCTAPIGPGEDAD